MNKIDAMKPDIARAAADIRVVGNPDAVWKIPRLLNQSFLFKAAAVLFIDGIIAGVLTLLWKRNIINLSAKDCLLGMYYIVMFGGAFLIAGKLDVKHAVMIVVNAIALQTWNTLFQDKPHFAVFIAVIGLCLPAYCILTEPETMKKMGLARKGIISSVLLGLMMAAGIVSYFAWGMKNFGFHLKVDPWEILVHCARVLSMYLSIFCFMYIAWDKLKSVGLSQLDMLLVLAIFSAAANTPTFIFTGIATHTPLFPIITGLAASICIMSLAMLATFAKFNSVLPITSLYTAMTALLMMTGLG